MTKLGHIFNELCSRTDYEQCRRPRAARFSLQSMTAMMCKGSVAYYLSWELQQSGKNVGLYTSPHLTDWRERVQINSEFASDDDLCVAMQAVLDVASDDATFFDLLTATAFQLFAQQQLDCMIIETGLGGRFDSTNVLQPLAAVITALELEHTDVLGDTLVEMPKKRAVFTNLILSCGARRPSNLRPSWCFIKLRTLWATN